jgi:hypothetical protein
MRDQGVTRVEEASKYNLMLVYIQTQNGIDFFPTIPNSNTMTSKQYN